MSGINRIISGPSGIVTKNVSHEPVSNLISVTIGALPRNSSIILLLGGIVIRRQPRTGKCEWPSDAQPLDEAERDLK
jgi:hypothetical protein